MAGESGSEDGQGAAFGRRGGVVCRCFGAFDADVRQGVQLGEGLGQLRLDDVLVVDDHGLEDRLVDESPDVIVGALVEVVEVFAEELEHQLQGLGDVVVADVQPGDQCFGVSSLALQPGLLLIEKLAGDAVFVVHVQQLALSLANLLEYVLATLDLPLRGRRPFAEVMPDRRPHPIAFRLAELDRLVVALDSRLDEVDRPVALGALAALVARADEVLVGAAVAFVARIEQP